VASATGCITRKKNLTIFVVFDDFNEMTVTHLLNKCNLIPKRAIVNFLFCDLLSSIQLSIFSLMPNTESSSRRSFIEIFDDVIAVCVVRLKWNSRANCKQFVRTTLVLVKASTSLGLLPCVHLSLYILLRTNSVTRIPSHHSQVTRHKSVSRVRLRPELDSINVIYMYCNRHGIYGAWCFS
jgi:hypothetical protein